MPVARYNVPTSAGSNVPEWIRKCATIINNHMRFYRDKGIIKLHVDNTSVGNVGTGEDDLITYDMDANTLGVDGSGIRITAWGSAPNNANNKALKLYFGATAIVDVDLTNNQVGIWKMSATVWRTGSSTQDYESQFIEFGTAAQNELAHGTATVDDSSIITIKCTGTGTDNNDIVQAGLLVEFLP